MKRYSNYILEKFQITKDSKLSIDQMTVDEFMTKYGSKNITGKFSLSTTFYKYPKQILLFEKTDQISKAMDNIIIHESNAQKLLKAIPKYEGYTYEISYYKMNDPDQNYFKLIMNNKHKEVFHASFENDIWFVPTKEISNIDIYEYIFKFVIKYMIDNYSA